MPAGKNVYGWAHDAYKLTTMIDELFNNPFGTGAARWHNAIKWGPTPERMFCMGGYNDIAQGTPVNPNLEGILGVMKSNCDSYGIAFFPITLLPLPENYIPGTTDGWYGFETSRLTYNTWIRANFPPATPTTAGYIDMESWMGGGTITGGNSSAPAVMRPQAWCQGDYVHMSAAGQQRFADAVAPYVLPDL